MKILVISEVFYPENFIINDLVLEWIKQGYKVEVITQYPSYPKGIIFDNYQNNGYTIENWQGIKIHRYPFIEGYKTNKIKKIINYIAFINGGKKIAKEIGANFDKIFISQTGPLTVSLPALKIKRKYKKNVTIWTFDIWPDVVYSYGIKKIKIVDFFLNRFIKKVYNQCDNILVSSLKFKDTINKYTDKPITYTPNWLQKTEQVKSELRLNKDEFNFTFTGNISLYQNLLNTIKGFVQANINNSVFNIIGDGSAIEELKRYIKDNKLNNVKLYGRYPYNQMNDILMQSNVLVLPLISNEGIEKTEPLKLQSYLSVGKPIYGVLNGSCKDIINENNLGLCANPADIDAISKGFIDMINFYDKQKDKVKESSKLLMENRFNREIIIHNINKAIGLN